MAEKFDLLFKVIIIGNSTVGKTKLLCRYLNKKKIITPTIGVDICSENIKIDEKVIRLCYWDTCGEERYKSITCAYYKEALGVFVVYDVTSEKSFDSIDGWIKNVKSEFKNENIVIVLLGNKCDLENERQITEKQGKKKAIDYGVIFFEVSAETKKGLKEAFSYMAESIYNINKKRIKNEEYKIDKEIEVIKCNKKDEECCFII